MQPEGSNQSVDPRGQSVPRVSVPAERMTAVAPTVSFTQGAAQSTPPRPRFRMSLPMVITTSALALIAILGGVIWYISSVTIQSSGQANQLTPAQRLSQYSSITIPLGELSPLASLQSGASAQQLLVNGQLAISNGLLLAPATSPASPQAGEFYYDKTTNQPYYYDGAGYVSIKAPSQLVTSIAGTSGAITLGSGLQLAGGQLTASGGQTITNITNNNTTVVSPATIDLQTAVTGTLQTTNGGTGATAFTTNGVVYGNGTGPLRVTAAAVNSVLVTDGSGTPSLSQTLPAAVQQNITATGALNTGSIASGFGTISTTNDIATTATLQGGSVLIGSDGGSPPTVTLRAGVASGNNITGGDLHIDASNGTGAGGSGAIVFRTAAAQTTPVTIDTTVNGGSPFGPALSNSQSITIGAHTNRLLMVSTDQGNTSTVASVTLDGTPLTRLHTADCPTAVFASGCHAELWYVLAPPTGSHTLAVTLNTADFFTFSAVNFYNVDQTTPFGTAQSQTGTSNTTSVTVASQPSQLVVDFIAGDHIISPTQGPSQSLTWNYSFSPLSSYQTGQIGTTTMDWTLIGGSNTSDYADYTVPINQIPNTAPDTLADRLSVTAAGDVGIGTTNPQATLDVLGSARIKSSTDSATAFEVQNSTGTALLTADTSSMKVSVAALQVTGTLTLGGHLITSGTTPAITVNTAPCSGTAPTASISGNDTSGTITVTTGTTCSGSGVKLADITFATAFGATPRVVISPITSATANTLGYTFGTDTTHFEIRSAATITDATTYTWNYFVAQ